MTKTIKQVSGISRSSGSGRKPYRVAIAQFAPVYLDKTASLAKAMTVLQDAKKHDVELVAFGEAWIPGYPAWLDVAPKVAFWDHLPTKQVFARL